MVGTQPVQRWPGSIRVLRLQPLERSQTEDFLVAQEIQRGQVHEFLNGALTQQNARDLEASRLVLSNPFDLTVIGDMLKGGLTPNLLTLPGAAIPDDGGDVPGEGAIRISAWPICRLCLRNSSCGNGISGYLDSEDFSRELSEWPRKEWFSSAMAALHFATTRSAIISWWMP